MITKDQTTHLPFLAHVTGFILETKTFLQASRERFISMRYAAVAFNDSMGHVVVARLLTFWKTTAFEKAHPMLSLNL